MEAEKIKMHIQFHQKYSPQGIEDRHHIDPRWTLNRPHIESKSISDQAKIDPIISVAHM